MPKKKPIGEKTDKRRRRRYLGDDGQLHWASGNTDGNANNALEDVKKKYGAGGVGDDGDITVKAYVERWLEIKQGDTAFNTWRSYGYQARKYIVAKIGGMKISAVKPSDLQRVVSATKDVSAATRNRVVFLCRSIFKAADIDRILYHNPAQGVKRKKDDAEKRLALPEHDEEKIKKYFNEPQCLILAVLYYTGLRRGEAYGLQWKHMDIKNGGVIVDQQAHETEQGFRVDRNLKTENSRRTVPMPPELAVILEPLRGVGNAYVFQRVDGTHYNAGDIENKLQWLREHISMPKLLHHTLRHNYATKLYLAGVQVKEAALVMGETVQVMLETYVHIEKQLGSVATEKIKGVFSAVVAKMVASDDKKGL
jgi:integrase